MERQTFHLRRTRQSTTLSVHGRPERGATQSRHSRVRPAPDRPRQTLQMRHRRRHAQTPHPSPIALEASPKCSGFLTQLLGSVERGFAAIFAVTNTVGTTTNYLDIGAATNVPAFYYRVRLVP